MATMLEAATLLFDPPNIQQRRGIPPMRDWPGRRMTIEDVEAACGDGRDWFRYWHRALRFQETWGEDGVFERARAVRSDDDYYRDFDWDQRLLIGPYGSGKSTITVADSLPLAHEGIPTFHNGPLLGGWLVAGDAMFTVFAVIPPCSKLIFDEAHTALPGRLAGSTAVSACKGLAANIRKVNCRWDLVSAQWKDVRPLILEDCVEVIEAVRANVQGGDGPEGVLPCDNPNNFVLAWDRWGDYPLKDPQRRQEGLGRPDYRAVLTGEAARNSFILTDSFQRVDMAAMMSNREVVKDSLRAARGDSVAGGRTSYQAAVIEFAGALRELNDDSLKWVTAGDIARVSGLASPALGTALSSFGLKKTRDRGYLAEDLIRLYERENTGEALR